MPIELTIGSGLPGLKTQALRNDKEKILASKLGYLGNAAVTPQFFNRFFADSGALDAKYPEQKEKRILTHDFNNEEKDAIFGAARSILKKNIIPSVLMVRADDYPLGLGLTKSLPVAIYPDRDDFDGEANAAERALFASRLFAAVKEVLASGFSREMQLFKQIKGIESTIGVMLTRLLRDDPSDCRVAPHLSINYIGKSQGSALYSYGVGLGGANNMEYVVGSTVSTLFPTDAIIEHLAHFGDSPLAVNMRTSKTEIIVRERNSHLAMGEMGSIECEVLEQIGGNIESFVNSTGSRYLELVKPRLFYPDCYVVQSAHFAIPEPQKPLIGGRATVFDTDLVFGSGAVQPATVRIAHAIPSKEDVIFNMENSNYLLIVEMHTHKDFVDYWKLQHYSNAAAIVLTVSRGHGFYGALHSHLGGPVRALGIPALACEIDKATLETLAKNPSTQTTVFADEFSPKGSTGFLAIE